ncbi:MAG TPA: GNAT family N-acetyltransferase [Gaiellaceae bacterium]|nr:GNAT family N-acetyltransferase [Gaiellaceae bacterium]
MQIRELEPADWPDVVRIYEEGIRTGAATFETEPPSWEAWDAGHLAAHRLVVTLDDVVVGWAALSAVSERGCYRGVAEHSIYIAERVRGLGFGRQLLGALIASSEAGGIWTLQSGVFPENEASLALHTALGFRVVGVRERLGRLHGVWRDVVLLERRSETNA